MHLSILRYHRVPRARNTATLKIIQPLHDRPPAELRAVPPNDEYVHISKLAAQKPFHRPAEHPQVRRLQRMARAQAPPFHLSMQLDLPCFDKVPRVHNRFAMRVILPVHNRPPPDRAQSCLIQLRHYAKRQARRAAPP